MKTIIKKIYPEWFKEIESGKKKFELRLADFEIKKGDVLRLEEWIYDDNKNPISPTGKFVEKKVIYIRKVDLQDWIKRQPEILKKGFYVIQFD